MTGGAAGLFGDLLDGIEAGVRSIANFATYYQMKSRAGSVGRGGLGLVLARVRRKKRDLPLHLVGHSFGGPVVTAAASTDGTNSAGVTMTLLQAAFLHNGFAVKFHKPRWRLSDGPQQQEGSRSGVVRHRKNDKAVGIAYPWLRGSRGTGIGLGRRERSVRGIGRNGAQRTS
jgi:pimeloyl-ACP methyl ester carboxylesterase